MIHLYLRKKKNTFNYHKIPLAEAAGTENKLSEIPFVLTGSR
jgi:hypothetical protein